MTASAGQVDGRNARRDRNTDAVLDAANQLFEEGNLVPTAEQVAFRSGVSLRSVYRYFEDTEALLRAAIARRVAVVEPLFVLPGVGEGPLPQRISRLVEHRLALYTSMGPAVRAALLRAPQAPPIAEQMARRRQQLTAQLEQHFAPELKALGKADGAALLTCIDALCQFEAMDHLRTHRKLSAARARRTLAAGITALLAAAPHDSDSDD